MLLELLRLLLFDRFARRLLTASWLIAIWIIILISNHRTVLGWIRVIHRICIRFHIRSGSRIGIQFTRIHQLISTCCFRLIIVLAFRYLAILMQARLPIDLPKTIFHLISTFRQKRIETKLSLRLQTLLDRTGLGQCDWCRIQQKKIVCSI